MTNFTTAGKIAWLELLKNADLYMAWGSGSPTWDVGGPPAFDTNAMSLQVELGRRKITNKQWAIPNAAGTIIVNAVKYNPSPTPTNYLYVATTFAPTEELLASIREKALFVNSVVIAATSGQQYFIPSQVTSPGTLLLGQNFAKIVRSGTISENFFFMIQL